MLLGLGLRILAVQELFFSAVTGLTLQERGRVVVRPDAGGLP